jgi:hypothetical protein
MTDKILTNRTNNTSGENEPSEIDDEVVKQFKFIITIVFIILLFSLGYFVYNLIKCYLPKWRKNKKLQEESLQPAQIMNEPKKNEGIMIEL